MKIESDIPIEEGRIVIASDILLNGDSSQNKIALQREKNIILLRHITGEQQATINHSPEGKPYCSLFKSISISHSGNYTALMMSNHPACGVDLQIYKEKTTQGMDYFMSEKEIAEVDNNDLMRNVHLYWCAKETAIKYFSVSGIDFKNKIYIHPFRSEQNDILHATVFHAEQHELMISYRKTENYALCFA